ncbi:MAG: diguanylate cyclase [Gammaproteobacteria bacterium]|nr:diguanylate cyclase [Gammaproteobacteria bacterium]
MSDTMSPEVFELILGSAPMGVLVQGKDNRVEWVNQALAGMLNMEVDEFLGISQDKVDVLELQLLFSEQDDIYIPPVHGHDERWLHRTSISHDNHTVHYYYDVSREHSLERERNRLESIVVESTTNDSVTGLLNRRGVIQRLEPQIARCRRYETPLSIILFTVRTQHDGLEDILGEQALLELGQLVKDYVRWADMVGHEGEGEFLMVLPETTLAGAEELAERLAKVIEDTELSGLPEGAKMVVNMGLSEWRKNDNITSLMQRITDALDDASSGDKQVMVA